MPICFMGGHWTLDADAEILPMQPFFSLHYCHVFIHTNTQDMHMHHTHTHSHWQRDTHSHWKRETHTHTTHTYKYKHAHKRTVPVRC